VFDLDVGWLLAVLRRRWRLLAMAVLLSVAAGLWYVATTERTYTALASLMIDTRRPTLFQQGGPSTPDPITDLALVESQLETLRSRHIAERVVRNLRLDQDEEFGPGEPTWLGSVRQRLVALVLNRSSDPAPVEEPAVRDATDALMRSLALRRVGSSYVIEIEAKSKDPQKAAQLANELVNAYIGDQLDFRAEILKREVSWLEGRIDSLRERADVADREVQDFKVANNILDANGRLIVDQQLADVSSQLAGSRADTARAKARLDRVQQIRNSRSIDESVDGVLNNEVITKLRQQLNEVTRREADWTARYGSNYPAAVNLRNEMASLQRAIQDEFARIAETYRSEYEIARAREISLERSLADQFKKTSLVRQAQVKLRGHESTAETYRALYDSFLQKYLQTLNQQTSPVTEARVITVATPPSRHSWPKSSLVMVGAASAGTLLGFALAMGRELMDRRIRTAGQVEQITGVRCVGSLPVVPQGRPSTQRHPRLPAKPSTAATEISDHRSFKLPEHGVASYALRHPYSQFAEVIRAVKVAIDLGNTTGSKVIGVVSTFPNEGKSTVAANFAGLVAQTGARVLLIDADLRNPNLTRTLAVQPKAGLLEVLTQSKPLSEVIRVDSFSGLHFLPSLQSRQHSDTSGSLAGAAMELLLADAQSQYDYIVLDLSPFGLIVDALAAAQHISDFVLVAEWGETSVSAVGKALANAPMIQEKLTAAILNKVNVAQYRAYDTDATHYHSTRYWSKYVDAREVVRDG
jgi:succinoglycan biosynthesis transport protein ExoP